MPGKHLPEIVRYENKIDRSDLVGCHPWTAARDKDGYGKFSTQGRSGKLVMAHRWGYEYYVGPIPSGMLVRHCCDNPPCQNREHWMLGTPKQNTYDMLNRFRANPPRGERCANAKLTEDQVRAIRQRYAAGGVTYQQLGNEYGLVRSQIFNIVKRNTWHHVV